MTREQQRREFLAKAQQADEQAEKAKDPEVRDSWKKIADGYRELAQRAGW